METNTTNQLTLFSEIKPLKLNLGCGLNKIEGFVNIDSFAESGADVIIDFRSEALPFGDNSVEEIVMFHCIEHLEERFHEIVLREMYRVLAPTGFVIFTYPEFLKCVEAYANNLRGQREFFKKTILGRQEHPGDYHVSIMDSKFFKTKLESVGFTDLKITSEPIPNEYYTIVRANKGIPFKTRAEILKTEIFT